MRTVKFLSEAEVEIRDSVLWYNLQQEGLGLEFVRCVDECIERIKRAPELYPKVHYHLRRSVVKRFPFIIMYDFTETKILVYAVFHSKRNPKKLIKRR